MGFLRFDTTELDLSRATISVWFRVPKESADLATWLDYTPDFSVFDGVVPIIAFGQQKTASVVQWHWTVVGYTLGGDDPPFFLGGPPTSPVHEMVPGEIRNGALAPSFIGVDKDGWLSVHIQTGDIGTGTQTMFTMTRYELIFTQLPPPDDEFYTVRLERDIEDTSNSWFPFPDSLGNDGLPTIAGAIYPSEQGFQVTFDEWHHLLLSWDLKGSNASHGEYWGTEEPSESFVDAASTLYCAIDDANKNGDELPGLRYPEMEPNSTISYCTYNVAGSESFYGPPDPPAQTSGPTAEPVYQVSFANGVKADGVFIPAELEYSLTYPTEANGVPSPGGATEITPIAKIQMAELQIFAGVTLDTSIATNRRAFLDYDKTGEWLVPVDMKKAEELIGRRADFILHGSSNWIKGDNTGATDRDGEKTGTIIKYPDPKVRPPA